MRQSLNNKSWPYSTTAKLFLSEFIGMALLMTFGLGAVVLFKSSKAVNEFIQSPLIRGFCTSFLFGIVGLLITLSPVGKISGAHLNPIVSFSFWLRGKMKAYAMAGFMLSQMGGAVAGCLPFLLFRQTGKESIRLSMTMPGPQGTMAAFLGEIIATSCLVTTVYIFVGRKSLRNYTPFMMPFLAGGLSAAESFLSGYSTNPARTFGPAFVGNIYTGFWIYIAGPLTAVVLVTSIFKWFRLHRYYHIEAARLSYHDRPSPKCLVSS